MRKTNGGFEYVFSEKGERYSVMAPNPGEELMSLNPYGANVVNCIRNTVSQKGFKYLHESVLSQKLFGIESSFVEDNPDKVREYEGEVFFDSLNEIKLFTNDKAGKSGRSKWYVADKSIISAGREYLEDWKVVVSSANAGGQKRSNQIAIFDNHSAFGRSRVALKTFKTEQEAQNFYAYATSELIRYAFLLTDEALTSLAKLVPDIVNYKDNNGIIDFHRDVNEQLYQLFGITEEDDKKHIRAILAAKAE